MDWLSDSIKTNLNKAIALVALICLVVTIARICNNSISKDGICQNCGERYEYLHEKLEGIRYTECPECGQKLKKY